MNRRNTLNTRLLPLSILISSLVSGGAMAAPQLTTQVPTGDFTRVADGGSILLGDNNKIVQPAVEKSIYEKLEDYLAANLITQEQKDKWQASLEKLDVKKQAEIDAQAAVSAAEAAAKEAIHIAEALGDTKAIAEVNKKDKEKAKKTTNEKYRAANREKDAAIKASKLDAKATNIAEQVTALVASSQAELDKNTLALVKTKKAAEDAAYAQSQHENEIQALITQIDGLDDQLDTANNDSATGKSALASALTIAQKAQDKAEKDQDSDIAKAKEAHRVAQEEFGNDKNNGGLEDIAKEKQKAYNDLVKDFEDAIEDAEKAVKDNEELITKLDGEKQAAESEKGTADGETQGIEQTATDAKNAQANTEAAITTAKETIEKAKAAEKAIADAEKAKTAADTAKKEFNEAETLVSEIETKLQTATQDKTTAETELGSKNNDLTAAQDAVKDLINNVSATDLLALDTSIAQNKTVTVAADTAAINTEVAGGTQTVADKGKIIGSIVTEEGVINLEAGAAAIDTVITQGTMTNNGGIDANTLVGAKGKLVLAGSDATHIAKSKNAKVLAGGEVILGDHSEVNQMVTSGMVKASGNALLFGTTIEAGELSIAEGAMSTGTTLKNGSFTVEKDGKADTTTIDDGVMTVNKDGSASMTTVNGGQFNLMDQANATQLLVENGYALIAGQLKDATFNGGKALFDTTAEVSGTINSGKDSVISVIDGANTQDANLNLAGNLQLLAGNAPVARTTLKRAAAMTNPAQFAFKNVTLNGGTVDMSSTNTQLTMTSLAGDGTFMLAPSLYNQANAPLNVTGDATGNFGIQLKDNGVAPTNLRIIDVQGNNAATYYLSNGPINLGNYKHTLVSDGQGGYKLVADTTALTPSSAGVLAVANTLPVIFSAELSSIQNRLDKQTTSANESGMWINYLNDNFKVSGTAANFDQKLKGMTLGGDKAIDLDDAVLSVGGFGSYSNSDIKSDYQSSGSVKSNSLGAYAQYLTNNGYYLNGVLKANQFKQNLTVTSQGNSASGSANVSGLGVAVKVGKHINFDAMYVSPYAALSTFASGKSQYQLSNGMDAKNQGSRNTTGTLGVNTGYRFVLNNGAEIKPYTLFSVDHDLMASNDVVINNETFDNSRKGTRVNAGVGVNINMTKNLSVGSEVKLSKGKNIDTPITINLGVGYTF